MKLGFSLALILTLTTFICAQIEKRPIIPPTVFIGGEFRAQCGSHAEESQIYENRVGKIIKILNASTIIFRQDASSDGSMDQRTFKVILAGVDSAGTERAVRAFLTNRLLNKTVSVWGNTKKDSDKSFYGIVKVKNCDRCEECKACRNCEESDCSTPCRKCDACTECDEINRQLVEKGLAKFKEPKYSHRVSYVTMCIYRQLIEKAKKENLGVWDR